MPPHTTASAEWWTVSQQNVLWQRRRNATKGVATQEKPTYGHGKTVVTKE